MNVSPVTQTPRDTIIFAADMNLLSREEAEKILRMIKSRNMTSPIYVEEIADQISKLIPDYYLLLITVAKRLSTSESGH